MRNNMQKKITSGFALISALYVLVVLALIGTFMVKVFGNTLSIQSQSTEGMRAYFAARSTLEWGIYQVSLNNACPASPTSMSFTQGGLNAFSGVVTCTATAVTEGSVYNIYFLTAVGGKKLSTITDSQYLSRTLTSTVVVATPQ